MRRIGSPQSTGWATRRRSAARRELSQLCRPGVYSDATWTDDGQLAHWFVRERNLQVDLLVVGMVGWAREHRFPDTGRHWVCPSPNMPTYRTTCVYPGGVLLEGTNLSEGRGTTIPLKWSAHRFLDELDYAAELNARGLPGVRFRQTRFRPTFDKWQGQSCRGVYLDVIDLDRLNRTARRCMFCMRQETGRRPICMAASALRVRNRQGSDRHSIGSDQLRLAIDRQCDPHELDRLADCPESWSEMLRELVI